MTARAGQKISGGATKPSGPANGLTGSSAAKVSAPMTAIVSGRLGRLRQNGDRLVLIARTTSTWLKRDSNSRLRTRLLDEARGGTQGNDDEDDRRLHGVARHCTQEARGHQDHDERAGDLREPDREQRALPAGGDRVCAVGAQAVGGLSAGQARGR